MDREDNLDRVDDDLSDAMAELEPLTYNPQRRAAWKAIQRARQRLQAHLDTSPKARGRGA